MFLGFYTVSTLHAGVTALGYILRFLPVGIGIGTFQSPNNSSVMGAAPRERLGVASGLLAITRTLGQTTGIAVLGALWAARVTFYAGDASKRDATAAPAPTQVAALHDTFLVATLFIAIALALASWGLVRERREQRLALAAARPPQSDETPAL
jgi:hypothetical protein